MSTVTIKDLSGNVFTVTWAQVFASVKRINSFFHEVGARFVEREGLLHKLLYAMCMREHLLIIGPHGTAKSKLVDIVFHHIDEAEVWAMDFTKFTVETHLFGAFDQKKMAETGRQEHMTEGSIVEAHFAKTGEFFDASDPTLRTLLGVLNERRVKRGTQIMEPPLVTCVADTNFAPETLATRSANLAAVVDRFLFRHDVDYVQDPRNRFHMLGMYLDHAGNKPLPKLCLQDVIIVSGVVHNVNLIKDPYVLEVYQEATYEYNKARERQGRPQVSDRRFVKAAQIMEVSALLHNRVEVTFDDLAHTAYALVEHPEDGPIFKEALQAALEKWLAKAERRDIERELHALREISGRIPQNIDLSKLASPQLTKLVEEVHVTLAALNEFQPEAAEVGKELVDAVTSINQLLAQTDIRMTEILVESLPSVEGPGNTLKNRMDQAKRVYSELRKLSPRENEAIIRHQQAMHKAHQIMAELETEFTGRGRI